jgi:hypothetical protein
MPARITLKAVNAELARLGHQVLLDKGAGYFYFHTGEAADWLDRTVQVLTLNALTVDEWIAEFQRLKKLNHEIMGKAGRSASVKRKAAK